MRTGEITSTRDVKHEMKFDVLKQKDACLSATTAYSCFVILSVRC